MALCSFEMQLFINNCFNVLFHPLLRWKKNDLQRTLEKEKQVRELMMQKGALAWAELCEGVLP